MPTSNPPHSWGGGGEADGGGYPKLRQRSTDTARKLRSEMSLPEVLLWRELRGERLGAKFRRQHPIGPYIADFYCSAANLVIEIDGFAHDCGDRPVRDAERDHWMAAKGITVVRVLATDVLRDMDSVLTRIGSILTSPSVSPEASHLPGTGEDLA
jgi:very-short-patch-repair endonuclease